MRSFLSLLILLLLTLQTTAQNQESLCSQADFDRLIRSASTAAAKGQYRLAILKYNAARVCNPNKSEEIDKKILNVFEGIEKLKNQAIADQVKADQAEEERSKIARASYNAVVALAMAQKNPTLGLQMAEYNYRKHPEYPAPAVAFRQINSNPENRFFRHSFEGHWKDVTIAAFSPDGKTIITGSEDNTIKMWSLDGTDKTTIKAYRENIKAVAFTSDGKYILGGGDQKILSRWDLSGTLQEQNVQVREGQAGYIVDAAFSTSGKYLITVEKDSLVVLREVDTGKIIKVFKDQSAINCVTFGANEQTIITGGSDGRLRFWNIEHGTLIKPFGIRHEDAILDVVISPDGKSILTVSKDHTAKLWSESGSNPLTLRHLQAAIQVAIFSPDGQYLITADDQGTVNRWLLNGQKVEVFRAHTGAVRSIAFSQDGKFMLTSGEDKTAKLWSTEQQVITFNCQPGIINGIAFSPGNEFILTGSSNRELRFWDFNGKELKKYKLPKYTLRDLVVSPNRDQILVANSSNYAELWNIEDLDRLERSGIFGLNDIRSHKKEINAIAISKLGHHIITGSKDATAKIWATQYISHELDLIGRSQKERHSDEITDVAFSPMADSLLKTNKQSRLVIAATASKDGTAKLWNKEGQVVITLEEHNRNPLNTVAFSPDGKKVLTGSDDRIAKLWTLDGKQLATFEGHMGAITSAAFSPDGATIITGSADHTIIQWDTRGNPLMNYRGHNEQITKIQFSADGRYILSGSYDQTAKLWPSFNLIHSDQVYQYKLEDLIHANILIEKEDLAKITDIEAWVALAKNYKKQGELNLARQVWQLILQQEVTPNHLIAYYIATDYDKDHLKELLKYQDETAFAHEFAIFFEKQEDWEVAGLFYQRLFSKIPNAFYFLGLYRSNQKLGINLEFRNMISKFSPTDLEHIGLYFYELDNWQTANLFLEAYLDKVDFDQGHHGYNEVRRAWYWANKHLGVDKFDELLSTNNPDELRLYAQSFHYGGTSNQERFDNSSLAVRLDQKLMDLPNQKTKENLRLGAIHCNRAGWYGLLTQEFEATEDVINQGLKWDKSYPYLMTNLPPALLLQGKFDEAKGFYESYMDENYLPHRNLPTYREVYLKDLEVLKNAGAIPSEFEEDVQKIIQLLNERIGSNNN